MAAGKETDLRRALVELETKAKDLRDRQAHLENELLSVSAASWPEAAAKARYVLNLYAAGLPPEDNRHLQSFPERDPTIEYPGASAKVADESGQSSKERDFSGLIGRDRTEMALPRPELACGPSPKSTLFQHHRPDPGPYR
jgi:hypothetical protein